MRQSGQRYCSMEIYQIDNVKHEPQLAFYYYGLYRGRRFTSIEQAHKTVHSILSQYNLVARYWVLC